MAVSSIQSPINITTTDQQCTDTCLYQFNYGNSSCTVTNNTTYIALSYDSTNSSIIYNNAEYTVSDIRLYAPSLNSYYGDNVAAELIINHSGPTSKNLLVCVPIVVRNPNTKSSQLLGQIISNVRPKGNTNPNSVNISNYNLNNVVPIDPYYAYSGTLPYSGRNTVYDVIVFDSQKSAANISSQTNELLQTLVIADDVNVNTTYDEDKLFYNRVGTTGNTGEDEIYIDCKPVTDVSTDGSEVNSTELEKVPQLSPQSKKLVEYALIGVGSVVGLAILIGIWKKVRDNMASE